jgi:hypothetical protein
MEHKNENVSNDKDFIELIEISKKMNNIKKDMLSNIEINNETHKNLLSLKKLFLAKFQYILKKHNLRIN